MWHTVIFHFAVYNNVQGKSGLDASQLLVVMDFTSFIDLLLCHTLLLFQSVTLFSYLEHFLFAFLNNQTIKPHKVLQIILQPTYLTLYGYT